MKINPIMLEALAKAIPDMPANATVRQRWDALWRAVDAGRWDVGTFYKAGMDDNHIDTALRRIAKNQIWR